MVRMFVRHEVASYDAWRKVYDDFDATRKGLGVVGDQVYRNAENGNELTITHDFRSIEAATSFAGSPKLHEAMAAAGVTGAPTIWFTSPA